MISFFRLHAGWGIEVTSRTLKPIDRCYELVASAGDSRDETVIFRPLTEQSANGENVLRQVRFFDGNAWPNSG